MADQVTFFSTLSNDAPNVWIAAETYRIAEQNLRLGKFARSYSLPQRTGKTLRIVRHKRLALPNSPLTEGTPPDAVALAIENIDVTVEQWGIVVFLTDVSQITTKHPALQVAIERSGLAMAEMFEREMAEMLLGGSNVFYPAAVTTRAGLNTEKIDTALVLKALTTLRNNGATELEGGLYGGVLPPQMEADIVAADSTFIEAASHQAIRKLDFGEIGVWMGVRWMRGNFLPIFKGVAAPDGSAASAEKAQVVATDTGGSLTSGNYQVKVVARDKNTDYERKISVQSANISSGTGNNDLLTITTPTSTNYVYDVYVTQAGGTTAYLVASRQAANFAVVVSTNPDAGQPVAPANPASGKEVFVAWVFGKDAFGRVELNGMSLQSYLTPAGASYSNPLAQGRKVGSKVMWKSFIIEPNYFARLEATSAYPAGLPA